MHTYYNILGEVVFRLFPGTGFLAQTRELPVVKTVNLSKTAAVVAFHVLIAETESVVTGHTYGRGGWL